MDLNEKSRVPKRASNFHACILIYLISILVNGSVIIFKIMDYNFYHTVPLVLRRSRQLIVAIAGYW
jgi:hypothetical protein